MSKSSGGLEELNLLSAVFMPWVVYPACWHWGAGTSEVVGPWHLLSGQFWRRQQAPPMCTEAPISIPSLSCLNNPGSPRLWISPEAWKTNIGAPGWHSQLSLQLLVSAQVVISGSWDQAPSPGSALHHESLNIWNIFLFCLHTWSIAFLALVSRLGILLQELEALTSVLSSIFVTEEESETSFIVDFFCSQSVYSFLGGFQDFF